MSSRFPAFGRLAVLALCLFATPIYAQTAEGTPEFVPSPKYDVAKEVTLAGTVSSVIRKATPTMQMLGGSHLILKTTSGKIDASLGAYAMKAEGALSLAPGQQVQVTGVMKTIRDQQIFVTRLVQVNGRTYKIRNEHGFVLSPQSHKALATSDAKGAQL